jgi:septum formation protein
VKKLAKLKAKAIAKQVDDGIIIGADTMVYIDGLIIGKPKDKQNAAQTLRLLDGKWHTVVSGICVINKYTKKTVAKAVSTKVKFRKLDEKIINWYVNTEEPLGKAGSYAIQGKGAILVESIKGDYYNIVGLPIVTLASILEEMDAL